MTVTRILTDSATSTVQRCASLAMYYQGDEMTATEIFPRGVIYKTLLGINRYFNVWGLDASHGLVRPCFTFIRSRVLVVG